MVSCGHKPTEYWCRPCRHWSISSYHGAEDSKRCGDQYLGECLVHAGEGRIRIARQNKKVLFVDTGYEDILISKRSGEHLHVHCTRTPKTFYYVFWDSDSCGRYGLVLRAEDSEMERLGKLPYNQWQALITPRMIRGFNNWLKKIVQREGTPQIVRDTQVYFEKNNFQLPSASGE